MLDISNIFTKYLVLSEESKYSKCEGRDLTRVEVSTV